MNGGSAGLRRWTQRFTVASAGSFVLFLFATLLQIDHRTTIILGLFGFVCPMIFGMAYLLLPAYAGQTLIDQRLAGIHFVLAYIGVGFLLVDRFLGEVSVLYTVGVLSWVSGVFVFVSSLAVSVKPVLLDTPVKIFDLGDNPQRSTKLATAVIPIAIGYLIVGTLGFLSTAIAIPIGSVTFPQVVHFYAIGFGTLLIYGLGARLLIGFFHVSLPRPLVWFVLISGVVSPAFLGGSLWIDPWFQIGAIAAGIAMIGYVVLVGLVARRAKRIRVGLSSIVLGAFSGVAAVGVSFPVAFGYGTEISVFLHGTLILAGFFPLTIVGYAYLFFPVSEGQFRGATPRISRTTIGLIGGGVTLQAVGIVASSGSIRLVGVILSVLGAIGYGYLLSRRFVSI